MGTSRNYSYFYKIGRQTFHTRKEVDTYLNKQRKLGKKKPIVYKYETYFSNGKTSKRKIEVKGKYNWTIS